VSIAQTECRECGCTVDCDSRGRYECTCNGQEEWPDTDHNGADTPERDADGYEGLWVDEYA
jgi:hypothetical protein